MLLRRTKYERICYNKNGESMTVINSGNENDKYRDGFVSVIGIDGVPLEMGHHVINMFYAETREEAKRMAEKGKEEAIERGEKIMKDDGTF